MNTLTFFLKDGQVLRKKDMKGTIPQLQRKFVIGKSININGNNPQIIEALTIEQIIIITFGEVINSKAPAVICFYREYKDNVNSDLKTISDKSKTDASVLKLDVSENEKLANALRIKQTPCVIIYQQGLMKYRDIGIKVNRIIKLLELYK